MREAVPQQGMHVAQRLSRHFQFLLARRHLQLRHHRSKPHQRHPRWWIHGTAMLEEMAGQAALEAQLSLTHGGLGKSHFNFLSFSYCWHSSLRKC